MHLELHYVPTYLRQTESVEPMVQIVYYAFAGAEFFFSGGAELKLNRKWFLERNTIEYYTEKIDELTTKLEAEQKVILREKQQASAFVFFKSRLSAACAAQNLHARMVDTWTVVNAPEPPFYMIPIGLVSAFTTLENLKKLLPFIKPWVKKKALRTVLEAYLPQLALIVFLSLLPKLLLVLSKAEGIPSEILDARAASGKYFLFLRVQCVYGCYTGWNSFQYIQNHPEKCR
ncbi:hypothetical protein POM88_023592 [Heracleum sosnowskyi]|uniref:Uncharacterized protein n=1 Tax=Heracleum sosnowskyi TaxID=360622 RepID=A0AAD8IK66_9APIA|nr:hypothetical protein POM88_023592 [Heracleum sosnowskyi]